MQFKLWLEAQNDFIGYHCRSAQPDKKLGIILPQYFEGTEFAPQLISLVQSLPNAESYPQPPPEQTQYSQTYWNNPAKSPQGRAMLRWASSVVKILTKEGYRWIFVSDKPLTSYGPLCYSVYLPKDKIYGVLEDESEEGNAKAYVFNIRTGMPKLVILTTMPQEPESNIYTQWQTYRQTDPNISLAQFISMKRKGLQPK